MAPNSCIFETTKSVKRFQPVLPAYVGPHSLLNTCQSHACRGVIINSGAILVIPWAVGRCRLNPVPAAPATALRNVRLEKLLHDPVISNVASGVLRWH